MCRNFGRWGGGGNVAEFLVESRQGTAPEPTVTANGRTQNRITETDQYLYRAERVGLLAGARGSFCGSIVDCMLFWGFHVLHVVDNGRFFLHGFHFCLLDEGVRRRP